MSILHKMVTTFAKEMIEHNLDCGATVLNTDYIAEQACDLAYKIDKKLTAYGYPIEHDKGHLSEEDVKHLIAKHAPVHRVSSGHAE